MAIWAGQLAAASGPQAIDVHPAAGAAVLTMAVAAALVLLGVLRFTRLSKIEPGPGTIDLRPEPPAVVDLLTGGFTVEDDAVPATVVDLAARGWFTIEDYGDETIIRLRTSRPTGDTLQPYEQRVLDHIEHHAIDGVVPTRVLTTGQKQLSKRWFKGFAREVTHHAQQLGLCTRRWGWQHVTLAWLLAGGSAILTTVVFDAAEEASDGSDWASLGNMLAGLAAVVTVLVIGLASWISRADAQKDTPAGAVAAAHWMGVRDFYRGTGEFSRKSAASVAIWDHHLAYATALGLADQVRRQIPFESEHDRHAWSRATGQWRRVDVRYRALRPGWGDHPLQVAFTSLLTGALFGAVAWAGWNVASATWREHYEEYVELTVEQEGWINLGAIAVTVLAVAVVAHAAVRFVFGCADLFRRRTIEGELVRARRFGGSDDSEPRYHVAIDTAAPHDRTMPGTVDTLLAYRVRAGVYHQVTQGARVRARVSPLLGYVASIETLVPAPARPASAAEPAAASFDAVLGTWTNNLVTGLMAQHQIHQPEPGDVAAPRFRVVEPPPAPEAPTQPVE